ncbi:serpin family protein, partial [Moorena sp. SIO4A5]|uniref:serpin family protein n=1 Tax=Moorena sp. SIO4A5 TaxID=2607838 RepID=UPI0026000F75
MNHQILSRIATVMAVSILLTGILGCVSEKTNALDPLPNSEPSKESMSADQKPTLAVDTNLVDANTKFGFKLFSEILKQDTNKNVFVSPTSIAIALDMAYNGASGETQEAMAKVLELEGLSLDQLNQGNNALKASLENADPDVQLSIANSLWANQGIDINPKFIKNNQKFYKAEVTELDFSSAKAAKKINRWVKNNTNGKIKKIVERTQGDELLFLINAIYFKGSWTREFDKSQTSDQAFYISDVNQKQHPMMYQYGKYQYYENDAFQAVSIPYGKERLSLYVFLPREGSSLAEFQQQLTAENWLQWMKEFRSRDGSIRLP